MKTFEISIPGVGRWTRLFPDQQTAQAWAKRRYPLTWPASVICLRGAQALQ